MYEVEYNGFTLEEGTELEALAAAKNIIVRDTGPVEQWAVEHDEVINVWFVQGLIGGSPVGSTATVTGSHPTAATVQSRFPAHIPADADNAHRGPHKSPEHPVDRWIRRIHFGGNSPAVAFSQAFAWIVAHQHEVEIRDVSWAGDFVITVYFHGYT